MRILSCLSLGLLLAVGCAESDEYETNKPVISDPADQPAATQPETGVDVDADLNDTDSATDATGTSDTSTGAGTTGTDSATSGATQDDAATDQTQPATP